MKENKRKSVLIAGGGQLGSRYLQSLTLCSVELDIYFLDISQSALQIARQRWEEVNGLKSFHSVSFLQSSLSLPTYIDLVIVSSTASVRLKIIKDIVCKVTVKYWLLEKIVGQSKNQMFEIMQLTKNNSTEVWVNCYMRSEKLYRSLKSHLDLDQTIKMKVLGGFNIASSSIHFIDLFEYLSGQGIAILDTSRLAQIWHQSERLKYMEINGTLVAQFNNGGVLEIESYDSHLKKYVINIMQDGHSWTIEESKGLALRDDGLVIERPVLYQSQRDVVGQILTNGKCDLPTYAEIYEMHLLYIKAFLDKWNHSNNSNVEEVPIT